MQNNAITLNRPNRLQKAIFSCLSSLIFFQALLMASAEAEVNDSTQINDLRVIVDISGSMKKTDPKNLRRPAVRLLAGLIPEGSRSGIWNFARQVNMSVKLGPVNEAWRALARTQSEKISSVGLYTNIESAMRKASFDWKKPDPRFKRNLILLTDGHVDLSDDEVQDKASRKRILDDLLPALEKAKVRIHTIALADDVDEDLLTTLSAYTDGLYKKVNNADELQKLFLQMLEQSIKLDTLPISNNQFNVDSSVNDMTLLVFNKNSKEPTKIVTPGKKIWGEKSNPEKVKWFRDEGFDLITIKKPQQGQWKIQAPEDKNNRVVIATNLKLKINDLPGQVLFGDRVNITAKLEEDGKPLTNKKLLSKFKFSIIKNAGKQDELIYDMTYSEKNNISEFLLPVILKDGIHELVIQAKSPTVAREVRHQFKVYETPVEITISEKEGRYEVKVKPYANLLTPDSLQVKVVFEDESKHELIRTGDEWGLDFDSKYKQMPFTINIDAIRDNGKPVAMSFNRMFSSYGETENVNKKATEVKSSAEYSTEKVTIIEDNKKKVADSETETESNLPGRIKTRKKETDMSWPMIIGFVAAGNIILIILFGGGYFFIKKRKAKMTKDVTDQIGDIDSGKSDKSEDAEQELKP